MKALPISAALLLSHHHRYDLPPRYHLTLPESSEQAREFTEDLSSLLDLYTHNKLLKANLQKLHLNHSQQAAVTSQN